MKRDEIWLKSLSLSGTPLLGNLHLTKWSTSDCETSRSDCETSRTDCATWIVKLARRSVKLAARIVKLVLWNLKKIGLWNYKVGLRNSADGLWNSEDGFWNSGDGLWNWYCESLQRDGESLGGDCFTGTANLDDRSGNCETPSCIIKASSLRMRLPSFTIRRLKIVTNNETHSPVAAAV